MATDCFLSQKFCKAHLQNKFDESCSTIKERKENKKDLKVAERVKAKHDLA